jgi:hypothetical protein
LNAEVTKVIIYTSPAPPKRKKKKKKKDINKLNKIFGGYFMEIIYLKKKIAEY